MKTAFVTGATGFLGRHLVDVLLEQGWHVTAMVRNIQSAQKILGDKVTLKKGDLTIPQTIFAAIPDKVDAVFHTAADTSTWAKEEKRQSAVNIEGTRMLLQAILDKDVHRLIHVSSIAVFGEQENLITEKTARTGAESWIPYTHTKSFAERKVKEAVDRGLDAVIVNPTHIIGRYDSHNWARLILRMANGTLPGTPPGRGNFANGRAVAEATVAAYTLGKTGHNYILGGPNVSFHEFLETAAREIGNIKPPAVMPEFLLKTYAKVLSIKAKFSDTRPTVTLEEAHMACEKMDVSSEKAIKELGYKIIPLEQSVRESITYLKEADLLPK
ncbi:NAD-dependent epimerase/dehydratase family protein [Kordiimonas pumila]|uniref:NAD-dependent epimerase/dehydratase family protein n=1 Tax=Kordiimonas pumila TaxID=2161677 RepID=A0ABV7D4N5_9PROT|nr:NAD-dependent epimerase/dehydratase family protein [Kordiimonas pumila]